VSAQNPGAFPLFDLLARQWRLPAQPVAAVYDAASSTLAAPLVDGRVALISVDDAEPAESRIVVDEAGRRTIAPRRREPRPAIVAPARGEGPACVAAAAGGGYVVARGDGGVSQLAADGAETPLGASRGVLALDASAQGLLAIVGARGVELRDATGATKTGGLDWCAETVAVSPDGARLAFGCGATLRVADRAAPLNAKTYSCAERVQRIVWRADGAYLVAICGAGGLALLDVASGRFGVVVGFPTPPRSAAFCEAANALIAAGAFRIAAWDLAAPPFEGERAGALETGRPGLAPVVEVAALPRRKLAAAAYANGRIVIAALGARDELVLQAAGPEPAALVAAPDGRSLAVAAGGGVWLLSLPDALFK
jgi:hypothetical protein